MFRHYLPSIAAAIALIGAMIFVPVADNIQKHQQLKAQLVAAQGTGPGDGLKATYFANTSFTNPVLTRVEPKVNFDLGGGSPGPGVPVDFSVRYTGQIQPDTDGTYTFFTINDDGVVLRIDNEIIINDPNIHPPVENRGIKEMEGGKRYDIEIEFFDVVAGATLLFEWEGPGIQRQTVPQRVLYSEATACSDKVDNDSDGQIDFPLDSGCDSVGDDSEENAACDDDDDNDGDGRIDFPDDPGCDSRNDDDETSPQCADGIDNDGDGVIDFENGDRGCDSIRDDSEENPPIDRNVGGRVGADIDLLGPGQYLPSILANESNNYAVRVPSGSSFELVNMDVVDIYEVNASEPLQNGDAYFHLLQGRDRDGKEHLVLALARHWDANTIDDPSHTPEPYFTFFRSKGNVNSCISGLEQLPSPQSFFEDRFSFQIFLDILSLCIN